MILKQLVFFMVCVLSAGGALASSDNLCEPDWTLNRGAYDRCSGLPMLTPGNDTRINLALLLTDGGFASLALQPVSKDDAGLGYGAVPFNLEAFWRAFQANRGLAADGGGESAPVSYGSASRCDSNEGGKADFLAALQESKGLSAAERGLLITARETFAPGCNGGDTARLPEVSSPVAQQFRGYLVAARAFYEGRFGEAEASFGTLARGKQPWLREAALYMLGRCQLNYAQRNAFDSYGFPEPEKADPKALQAAEAGFSTYLKEYPAGMYAASARGLLRRIYWFSGQYRKLADEYAWQLSHTDSPQHNLPLSGLIQEADSKLFAFADPARISDPLLLAVSDLMRMRPGEKQLGIADLQRQKPLFAKQQVLYDYLLAACQYYVRKDAAAALQHLTDTTPENMGYLGFSRLMLRGLALESAGKYAEARMLWLKLARTAKKPLQGETVQLALAINYEQRAELEPVFAPGSLITEPAIRTVLIRNGASGELLRSIIAARDTSKPERRIALHTLLYKDLLQGRYDDYVRDYPLLPHEVTTTKPASEGNADNGPNLALFRWSGKQADDGYDCPATIDIARRLAKNPKDTYGLLCLGDFVNANDLDSGYGAGWRGPATPTRSTTGTLGMAPSLFAGKPFVRGESYKQIIDAPDVAPELKAYALYRAIRCYATSGYNHCGGAGVEPPARKAWFMKLKKQYPRSPWSQALKYYW